MKSTIERNEKKVRVLFVIDELTGGGAEKVLQTLVNHMNHERFDITVLTFEDTAPDSYLIKEIHYRSIYRYRTKAGRLILHSLFRLLAEAGAAHSLFVRDTYDIEIAYLEYGPTKFVAQSPDRKSAKVAWVHCDMSMNHSDRASIQRQKKLYGKFDRIACVSPASRDGFQRLFGKDLPTQVIPNVIDEEEILRKAAERIEEEGEEAISGQVRLVAVGRLTQVKGYDRLLQCCSRFRNEGISFYLEILGEGEARAALEEQIRREKLEQIVRLRGFTANPYPYMRRADVLVCSSHYEGSSTVIREAMILGKPVVTTDCGDMREILGESVYGILTENSLEGLYQGLRRMVTSVELRTRYEKLAAERGRKMNKAWAVKENEDFLLQTLHNIENGN